MSFVDYIKLLVRKRRADVSESETLLNRCLPTIDLTLLGVGSMLGGGLYVATTDIASKMAGPAIVLSLLIAAVPAILASLCYAEFGARLSRTGSSFSYTYYSLGEIWAFMVGWQLLLENVVAASLMAQTMSAFVDDICAERISTFFEEHLAFLHNGDSFFRPDFLAFAFAFVFTVLNASGTKHAALFIRVASIVNLLTIIFLVLTGFYYMEPGNWASLSKFAPFGFGGILDGAALSYFAFLGFDVLNNASEEVNHPKRSVPFAQSTSTYIGVFTYLITAAVITLVIPYSRMPPGGSLPLALGKEGFRVGQYVVGIGGIFALGISFLAYNFSASRIMYAMSQDHLLCPLLYKINARTQVPIRAVMACGLASSLACLFVDFRNLMGIVSIGTLVAYAAISAAVLLERYRPPEPRRADDSDAADSQDENANPTCCGRILNRHQRRFTQLSSVGGRISETATADTYRRASVALGCLFFTAFALTLCISPLKGLRLLLQCNGWVIATTCLAGGVYVLAIVVLVFLPRCSPTHAHATPCVPVTTLVSISLNIYLVGSLSTFTWAIFIVWMFVGELREISVQQDYLKVVLASINQD